MSLRIHVILIALNEADFITENLKTLYPFVSGISVITQYDRDYYGRFVTPDTTVQQVLDFPDPEGKIHLVVRRYNDETASRNHEMKSLLYQADRDIQSHGVPMEKIAAFHAKPDYFWIVDADEIYDVDTIPAILDYLEVKRPRGMRVSAYEYGLNWNRRVPLDVYVHHHFGFIKAGLLFTQRRVISWNEMRLKTILKRLGLNPNWAPRLFGFIDCPREVGMFHHGAYVRKDQEAMKEKMRKHSHPENHDPQYLENILSQRYEQVSHQDLPRNIVTGNWPANFFEKP